MLENYRVLRTQTAMPRHEKPSESQPVTDTVRTRRNRVRLTDQFIRGIQPPSKGNTLTYDDKVSGFAFRITSKGATAFVLNYYFKGRERRKTIGTYPEWTVTGARKKASEYRHQIDNGVDPLEQSEKARNAPTMKDLFERYDQTYLPKLAPRNASNIRSMFKKTVLPVMGARKVEDITFSDCERIHRKVSETYPLKANRLIGVLRRCFNLAIKWGWIETNPASGIELNNENKRERYLSNDEVTRLVKALSEHPQRTSCDALLMMLLTGCRRGEALNAKWDQFSDDFSIWIKPAATTKQRLLHRAPVSAQVRTLLRQRFATRNSEYVFEGPTGRALTDVKRTWKAVTEQAEIANVRIHDLRHTFASIAVSNGASLPTIGKLLGHTQTQTTERYAHLADNPLAALANLVSENILPTNDR